MNFRTELIFQPERFPLIDYNTSILTIGSCFASTMGQKLIEGKFNTLVNPFGTLFNPLSIFCLLDICAENLDITYGFLEQYCVQNPDGLWQNYLFHSSFGASEKKIHLQKIQEALEISQKFIQNTPLIIITLGTAWVYELAATSNTVANCHKMPTSYFRKRLLSVEEVCENFEIVFDKLRKNAEALDIILTVSPVRHIKDTLSLNSVSKSVLRLASHYLSEKFEQVYYFPSYEWIMDDLRDYRFYKEDMLHPTTQAEEYIWEQFRKVAFSKESQTIYQRWLRLKGQLYHRPLHTGSPAHLQGLRDLLIDLSSLSNILSLEQEMELLNQQITSQALKIQKNIR